MIQYFKEKFNKYANLILQLDDTPESIAMGVALGMFVAMTPTVGIQMIIILVLSFVIRLNRIAGWVLVYVSNPFTMIPIYWLDYWTGSLVMGYEMVGRESFNQIFALQSTTFYGQFLEFMQNCLALGLDVVIPMFVGGALWGLILGAPLYPLTLRAVRKFQSQKGKEKGEGADVSLPKDLPFQKD